MKLSVMDKLHRASVISNIHSKNISPLLVLYHTFVIYVHSASLRHSSAFRGGVRVRHVNDSRHKN